MGENPPGDTDVKETKEETGELSPWDEQRWYSLVVIQNNGSQAGEPAKHSRTIVVPGQVSKAYVWRQLSDEDINGSPTQEGSKHEKLTCTVYPTYVGHNPLVSERPNSFGLHSPDQLPKTESEFRAIASSFGLHSPDQLPKSENLHPSYNPRLFCDGGLYLDPDIIGE